MADPGQTLVAYDRAIPEIPGRTPWEAPDSHLLRDESAPGGWKIASGRRPSRLLLPPALREAVDAWRSSGYPGASEVSRRLFSFWFEEDHWVRDFDTPFRFYFGQREAIETLVWLTEIEKARDLRPLLESRGRIPPTEGETAYFPQRLRFPTTAAGKRQLLQFLPEEGRDAVQDLPPSDLRRYAFRMATGSGKTWVMAMAVVWAWFHRQRVPGSDLPRNFLIAAPNLIVFERLRDDFEDGAIFGRLPLIPPEWKGGFAPQVILRGEATEPGAGGALFLTNIQQLHEARERPWEAKNPVDSLLGPPAKDPGGGRPMLERLKSLPDLMVLNDEAHHVHDEELAWSKSLLGIHRALPRGLGLWLDFSATPHDQNRVAFPWTVCDYPLAQAVEDRIVKVPLVVDRGADSREPPEDPKKVTGKTAAEQYDFWLRASVRRLREHEKACGRLRIRPILFVVAEEIAHAKALGAALSDPAAGFGFGADEVLVIHTDKRTGEIAKGDLEAARRAAREVDSKKSRLRVIVSVLMLREGWDVKNVAVVLGLRPFTAKADILPEQVIGRGLRLMRLVGPERTQTLEVLGTRRLLDFLREKLEAEGVAFGETKPGEPLPKPEVVQPLLERADYDIAVPITLPQLTHDIRRLEGLDIERLDPLFDAGDLAAAPAEILEIEHGHTGAAVSQDVLPLLPPRAEVVLDRIVRGVAGKAGVPSRFAELFPLVRGYLAERCYGEPVDLEEIRVRHHLTQLAPRERIAALLAREIGQQTVEQRPLRFEKRDHLLSETRPFHWRRNLPLYEAKKTVFNRVASWNGFEKAFARFLDRAEDVARFAALGTTEQGGSGTTFRVDYLKPGGAIGFYYPDWVVVQESEGRPVNWILETKGRVFEGTGEKDAAMSGWCERVRRATGEDWRFVRINQREFDPGAPTLAALIAGQESAAGLL